MKQTLLLFAFLFVLVLSSSSFAQDYSVMDFDPDVVAVQADTIPPVGFPFPTLFNFHYSTIGTPAINGGTVGAMYFNNLFYLNRWNSTMLYRYNGGQSGPTTLSDSAVYQGSIRDLTTDGNFLFGSAASTTIHIMNANGISQGTITSAGGVARAIAYSADENVFFVCDFSNNIGVINAVSGALVRTLTGTSTISSKYGMAYSNVAGDVPAVWVWGQGTTANPFNTLTKINPQTGAVLATYLFGPYPVPVGSTSHSGIAGGAEVCQIGDKIVLILNHQNWAVTGYVLADIIPVELTSFTASSNGSDVTLNWQTATETNNHGFEVQRKIGERFTTIGFVEGFGTTTETKDYTFTDSKVASGTQVYRLKQIDFDGASEYSQEVEVEVITPSVFALDQNYPNPFNPSTTISFSLAKDSRVTVKVFDVVGQEVATIVNNSFGTGSHEINFDASNLNSGVYIYRLEASAVDGSTFSAVKKMTLTK
ncbi:MAG: T9SS type A sorting domain-containing protein [Ignavibacteriales bacterium]|nr:MAG: T9SS type A sorting domain-containing protein [Ignavibacteriales bacterium]